jgi:hypothetical protein
MGFTIDSNFANQGRAFYAGCLQINDYVLHGLGDPGAALTGRGPVARTVKLPGPAPLAPRPQTPIAPACFRLKPGIVWSSGSHQVRLTLLGSASIAGLGASETRAIVSAEVAPE